MTPPPLSILYEKFIAKICIFLRFWGFFGANVSKDEIRILLLRLVCAAQRAAEKIRNTIRTVGFAKAFCLFAGKNAPKVCGLYLARQAYAPAKNLDRYAVFYKTVSFWQRPYAGKAAKVFVLAALTGQNAARNTTRTQKRNRVRLLKTRASQGCNKKTFRRALSFDLTGEIAYNLCITTCGVCRKNKGVTVC